MKFVQHFLIFCCLSLISYSALAQTFSHADTLRGSDGDHRHFWKVLHYDITVQPNIKEKTIKGCNKVLFKTLWRTESMKLQIDLQEPLSIDSAFFMYAHYSKCTAEDSLSIKPTIIEKEGNVYFINIPRKEPHPLTGILTIYYHGKPREAVKPPWDGGMVWSKDENNDPWISTACQDLGASAWFPCKDIQSDEPDSGATIHIIVPDSLIAVSNGRLIDNKPLGDGTTVYTWNIKAPINNYDIVPYIGKYVHFGEVYGGEKGDLDMDYWVLDYNLDKAKKQFKDATRMMKAFEYWFGPYPFYEDGYKLVDAPYLGMENQSGIAYGNDYMNGYLGKDLSKSGWGLKWDFIIVHESAHEWFGNSITSNDIADMWIHEAFASYAETLFTEYYYGKEAADDYEIGVRKLIENKKPMISHYGVNEEPPEDIYFKGSNMIHTIRQVINNDSLFRQILRGLNTSFYHQTVTTKQIEDYISNQSHINLSKVFDQYLRTTQIPTLEYKIDDYTLSYRWANCIKGFNMPVTVNFKGPQSLKPTEEWKSISFYPEGDINFSVNRNFYINTKKVK